MCENVIFQSALYKFTYLQLTLADFSCLCSVLTCLDVEMFLQPLSLRRVCCTAISNLNISTANWAWQRQSLEAYRSFSNMVICPHVVHNDKLDPIGSDSVFLCQAMCVEVWGSKQVESELTCLLALIFLDCRVSVLRRILCKSSSFNDVYGSYSCCCCGARWVKLHLADSIWFHISSASKPRGPTTIYLTLIILRHLLFTTITRRRIEGDWEREKWSKREGGLRERERKKSIEGWDTPSDPKLCPL